MVWDTVSCVINTGTVERQTAFVHLSFTREIRSGCVIRNLGGQKAGLDVFVQSVEGKKLSTKTPVSGQTVLQK